MSSSTRARRCAPRRTTAALVGCALVALTPPLHAGEQAGRCSNAALQWIEQCRGDQGASITPVTCLEGRLVLDVAVGGSAPLRVEVVRGAAAGVLHAGGAAISPAGGLPDGAAVSRAQQQGLEIVAACIGRDAGVLDRSFAAKPAPSDPGEWSARALALGAVLLAGAVAAGALLIRRLRRARGSTTAGPAPSGAASSSRAPVVGHLAFFALCALVELWARRAADPDFPLPDPFHPLVAALLAVYGASLLVPWRQVRYALVTLAFAVPALVLGMEVWLAMRDRSIASQRMLVSDDRLLRYSYRPGAIVRGKDETGAPVVTEDGLLDVPHAVPKPEGVLRVVVLGDSVPNDGAVPYAQRFPKRLEALLGEHAPPGRRVEVVNVSCEGYNTIQEVRLLEKVGLRYQPDVVVVAYVLNDPFLQNGAYRRLGNSFFTFKVTTLASVVGSSACALFTEMHDGYPFDLVVRASFERLRLLSERHGFRVLVAPLPILERFDDPLCLGVYDKVVDVARAQGFEAGRVVDGFRGEDYRAYLKPGDSFDITHPNAAGHDRIGRRLAELVSPMLAPAPDKSR